jgi:hypothetical protein
MHLEAGQSLVSLQFKVVWSYKNISNMMISTWGFTMLTIMCSQFSMLNIYHPCGCHLKDRNIL